MLVQRTSLLVLLLVLHSPARGQEQNETRVDDGHVTHDPSIHFPRGQEDCETDSDCGLTLACIEVNRRFFTQDRSLRFTNVVFRKRVQTHVKLWTRVPVQWRVASAR